ncbi:MAG: acyltransferase [Bacteroidota bacterium]
MSGLEKLKKDFLGTVFSKGRKYRLYALRYFSTFKAYLWLGLKGVQLGKEITFMGSPYVRRSPLSSISIGDKCRFRSDSTSNLVGVNRRCLLNTHKEGAIIKIGKRSGFSGVVISAMERVEIGDNLLCGANVLITDFDFHYVDPTKRHIPGSKSAPVIIEDNVWLGINTVVLKGVRIGENSVIAANSLVIKDIPPNVIAGGNPCKVIKELAPVAV